jgi:hypothetical protein
MLKSAATPLPIHQHNTDLFLALPEPVTAYSLKAECKNLCLKYWGRFDIIVSASFKSLYTDFIAYFMHPSTRPASESRWQTGRNL